MHRKRVVVLGSGAHAHIETAVEEKSLEGRLALVLSTAHITPKDDEKLTKWTAVNGGYADLTGVTVLHLPVGYLVMEYRSGDPQKWKPLRGLSRAFSAVLVFAKNHGFDWVQFHPDAQTIEELKVHDW